MGKTYTNTPLTKLVSKKILTELVDIIEESVYPIYGVWTH